MYLTFNNIFTSAPMPIFNGAKTRKLIEKIENAKRLNKVEVTLDELERMYNEIGYDLVRKRGSHVIVPLTDDINISIATPHGGKYVHINDLKRFLLVKEGKFLEATKVH